MVAAGHSHSGAIVLADITSQLYLWGANQDHRLMQENCTNQLLPQTTILE